MFKQSIWFEVWLEKKDLEKRIGDFFCILISIHLPEVDLLKTLLNDEFPSQFPIFFQYFLLYFSYMLKCIEMLNGPPKGFQKGPYGDTFETDLMACSEHPCCQASLQDMAASILYPTPPEEKYGKNWSKI